MGVVQDSLDRQWRNALQDLRTMAAQDGPHLTRDAGLRQLELLITCGRYDEADVLANVILSTFPSPSEPWSASRWFQALAWLALTIALLFVLALAVR